MAFLMLEEKFCTCINRKKVNNHIYCNHSYNKLNEYKRMNGLLFFFLGLILLTIAVSLDSFGIGISYGLIRIRVPYSAILIIMICSGFMVLLSMTLGTVLSYYLTPEMAKKIGGTILIGIGIFNLVNVLRSKRKSPPEKPSIENRKKLEKQWKIHLQKLGIIITILKEPQEADLDNSGVISKKEALLLGLALSLDAFSTGIGAALLGYPPILCAIFVAIMSGLGVSIGMKLGFKLSEKIWVQQVAFLPPFLLMFLGLTSFFK